MKHRKISRTIPAPTEAEILATLPKSVTIQLRLSKAEKVEILACKDKFGLTTTAYLLGCHNVVADKIRKRI